MGTHAKKQNDIRRHQACAAREGRQLPWRRLMLQGQGASAACGAQNPGVSLRCHLGRCDRASLRWPWRGKQDPIKKQNVTIEGRNLRYF